MFSKCCELLLITIRYMLSWPFKIYIYIFQMNGMYSLLWHHYMDWPLSIHNCGWLSVSLVPRKHVNTRCNWSLCVSLDILDLNNQTEMRQLSFFRLTSCFVFRPGQRDIWHFNSYFSRSTATTWIAALMSFTLVAKCAALAKERAMTSPHL